MKKRITSNKSLTDWARLDTMRDGEIDLLDSPEISPEMFARGVVRRGLKPLPPKAQITLRLDYDVLAWFKARGRGYQTRVNALLRAYMEAHQRQAKRTKVGSRRS